MKRNLIFIGILLLLTAVFISCGGDENPVTPTNNAPGIPTIDGAPASGATDIVLAPTLGWNCTDPDDDALTFTVSFGTATAPPVVSSNQAASTYSPTSLSYSTKYYWLVSAKDPSGATTSSAVWNFTTLAEPPETLTTPTVPTGPTTGDEAEMLEYSAIGSVSNLGHDLEYRFDWGDGNFSSYSSTSVSNFWATAGTYEVKTQARCITHTSLISEWSAALTVTITVPVSETVSAPTTITGPTTGIENQDLSYNTSGAVSNLGHDLEYKFDWGDGNFSDWVTTSVQGSWATAGTYDIKAQARCITHPTIISDWSDVYTVTISVYAAETVSVPDVPGGPTAGETGESLRYTTAGSVSSYGDDVQYRFDWGDSTMSSWYNVGISPTHAWSAIGSYDVKVQARCLTHISVESDWSAALTVTIILAAGETVSAPDAPSAPATGTTDLALVLTNNGGAVSSDGHSLEYRFDYGDGGMSNWYYNWTTLQHTYTTAGTYNVAMQARCTSHPTIESAWSDSAVIIISDPPEAFSYNTGILYGNVTEGQINESYEYSVSHSSATNWGDPMEGQYDWGDGTTSDWSSTQTQSHVWTTEGTYNVSYKARCTVHNDFMIYSDTLVVTILAVVTETVATPGYINWQDAQDHPMLDTETIYYAYGGLSSLGHDTESRIAWGDGDTTGWIAMNTQIFKTWTVLGTFSLTRQSRCVAHPDIISEWSEISYIITGPETVSAPDAPSGPNTAFRNVYVDFISTGALSSWHSYSWLSYRFAWGDGDTTAWLPRLDTVASHRYTTHGDYEVRAQAKCIWPGHTNPVSEWSLPTLLSIIEKITLYTDYGPKGPNYVSITESNTWEVYAAANSDAGHAIEYQFDWGDGNYSDWASPLTASYTYSTAGTYDVYIRARCSVDTIAVSEWSVQRTLVEVTDGPELVSTPDRPDRYPSSGDVGEEIQVSTDNSYSNYGHAIEYQFDLGDGTLSDWIPSITWGVYHTYTSVGTYTISCQARCATHPSIVSDISPTTTIDISEALDPLLAPTGPLTGTVGANLTYTTTGTTSSEGHALEYRFYYYNSNGSIPNEYSDWSTSLTDDHVFVHASDWYYVRVQARCIEHPTVYLEGPYIVVSITE